VMHVYVNGVQQFSNSMVLNQRDKWPAVAITISGNGTQVSFAPLSAVTSIPAGSFTDALGDDLSGCTADTN